MNISVFDLTVSVASAADAVGMVEVIHAAFGARPPLNPPSTASSETPDSVRTAVQRGAGIYAEVDGRPAGALLINEAAPRVASFGRVSVHPDFQRHGIASTMVAAAHDYAAELGYRDVELFAREEFAELILFWRHRGYEIRRPADFGVILGRQLPVAIDVPTARAMQELGTQLASRLRPGDLIIAAGDLGAGKTTLTQGIGSGLGAEGPVISPTFVLARVHRSTTGRPPLVHVDAYRLSGAAELDDLGLDESGSTAVTVVEWGTGLAEGLADSRLEIDIRRSAVAGRVAAGHPDGDTDIDIDAAIDEHRTVLLRGVGRRWDTAELAALRELAGG